MTRRRQRRGPPNSTRQVPLAIAAVGVVALVTLTCGLIYARILPMSHYRVTGSSAARAGTLRLAYSPEKAALFAALLPQFESQGLKTASGQLMHVEVSELLPERMLKPAVSGDVDAICPDSSLWLTRVDEAWAEASDAEVTLVGETVRFAISPVVIAMREDVARSLGYPDKAIGWGAIIAAAQGGTGFTWSHASTATASGLLATLAEFYAGAGKTRGLTIEDVRADSTLRFVASVEATVRQYGEGELATVERALAQGGLEVDAAVMQEQLVVYYNGEASEQLVAIYPAEGTLWQDHPFALLEHPGLSADARETYQALKRFLVSAEAQQVVLGQGYRPSDLSIPLDAAGSPLTAANGVDPSQPQTVLQMPSALVVSVVRDAWWYTKRHTNVYLVVDSSGSMEGDKMDSARLALAAFLESIRGDRERVGLVEFSTEIERLVPLDELGRNRSALELAVSELHVGGDTALVDAVSAAYTQLQELADQERINAIVVMTDGRENASRARLRQLVTQIRDGNRRGTPIVVFCIAYGSDADLDVLKAIADASEGQVRQGDRESIEELYRLISTYL